MDPVLRYTLIADGSSDKALLHIVKWSLDDLYPKLSNEGYLANFSNVKNPPRKSDVSEQVRMAQELYPFDILLYHRDAENQAKDILEQRKREVFLPLGYTAKPIVCVIPIKMTETWLLINEDAIKKAAGNRNYRGHLQLPPVRNLEKETNPKKLLHTLLKESCGLNGRRLDKFNVHKAVHRVAENIQDFSPLRSLSAFRKFEEDLKEAVQIFMSS